MKVIDLLLDDDVRKLAAPETILAGHELVKLHEVAFGTFSDATIEASVPDDAENTYATVIRLDGTTLNWQCACGADNFCKHLVATALAAQRKGRGDIYKAAGIILQDRRMLVERSIGKPAFIAPGGRIQEGETVQQALIRELQEEFQITVQEADLQFFGSYSAEAANHPGQQVHMQVYLVKKWQGEIQPNNEVEEIRWLSSQLPTDIEVGSIFGHEVLPELKIQNLID